MSRDTQTGNEFRLRKSVECLHCWEAFQPEDVLWISEHRDLLGDPLLGGDHQQRFLPTRFSVDGEALDARDTLCHDVACPHCHLPLPRALLELSPLFVSIVGLPTSGKSFFLGALIWSLRRLLPTRFAVEFNDADTMANQVLHSYEEQLFLRDDPQALVALGDLIPKTQLAGDLYSTVRRGDHEVRYAKPFSFTLQLSAQHPQYNAHKPTGRILCLYDNAGEHFLPGQDTSTAPGTRHLAKSNILLFLYDPSQDPRMHGVIRSANPDHVPPPTPSAGRQESALHEVASRVRKNLNLKRDARLEKPLFVLVTKADLWLRGQTLPEPWKASAALRVHAFDRAAADEMSSETRSMLNEHVPELIMAAESIAETVCYVPVSSLGVRPQWTVDGKACVKPADLQPQWVTVPFVYGLSAAVGGIIARVK